MHMRLVRIKTKRNVLSALVAFYETEIIPTLEQVQGCRYAGLMHSTHYDDECLSLTLWNAQEDAEAYERSGVFASLLHASRPYLLESSEYQIRLSKDLTLEYVAVPEVPIVSAMPVAAESAPGVSLKQTGAARWLRTVALKIRPGSMDEFREFYVEQVIPALRGVKGCRHVYLTENTEKQNEVISITSWESEYDARRYEQSGLFQTILKSQNHLLSDLYQLKHEVGRDNVDSVSTSEDLAVEHYTVLTGRGLNQTS